MVSPGTTLGGRYRLDERIAGGGMGDVWRGTDEVLGRTVAVKILLPALLEEAGFAERFRGEARTMATINHPGVVDIYDYGNEGGTAFLVMEYVEGDALSRTLGRVGRLTPARTMALLAQAADALHAAHEKGIVHRDVKPGNLLVRPNGTLVLTDFGIARSAAVGQLTVAGTVLGTASYLSPEQASGATATALSDVYALGVVGYQCLAGRRPFEGDNPLEIALRHVRDAPPPLPADIPVGVRQIVERAMAKDPGVRWPSAAAFAKVARAAAAHLAAAHLAAAAGTALPTGTHLRPGPGVPVSGVPSSGAPTSGPPAPLSPAPPVSAAPVSAGGTGPVPPGAPPAPGGPLAPGGTRVMSPGAGPWGGLGAPASPGAPVSSGAPASGGPSSPPGPGKFARGAAGVPPSPSAPETGYTYVGAGGYPPTGPVGRPPAPPGGDKNRRNVLILGIAAGAALLLLLICGGAVLVYQKTSGTPASSASPSPTGGSSARSASPSAIRGTGPRHTLDCKSAIGSAVTETRKKLEDLNYKVKTVDVAGGSNGRVKEMSPCGSQPEGTEITLTVFTGKPANSSGPATPTESCLINFCIPTVRVSRADQ